MKTNCYCCTREATHRIYEDLKAVCTFHYHEALEEENQPILVMKIEEVVKSGQAPIARTA
jgi:hypothetical protein